MNNQGMTMLELTMAVAIFTIVMGALFGMAMAITDTVTVQDVKLTAGDETRRALVELVPELREAARQTINLAELPGQVLRYQAAADLDGNGVAVDVNGELELTPERTVQRDTGDANGDGITDSQLVIISGDTVRVIANGIALDNETLGDDDILSPEEDTNGNGRLDRGFWVELEGDGLRVSVQSEGETRRGHELSTSLSEFVIPRN